MSNIARAKVVAELRDLARQAASAADNLEHHASTDQWAHKAPSYVDLFAMSDIGARFARGEIDESEARALAEPTFTKAEVEERNEGLRCAMLLAARALSAVHCLSAPGDPAVIERNARAACAGWEAVVKADARPNGSDTEAGVLHTILAEVGRVYAGQNDLLREENQAAWSAATGRARSADEWRAIAEENQRKLVEHAIKLFAKRFPGTERKGGHRPAVLAIWESGLRAPSDKAAVAILAKVSMGEEAAITQVDNAKKARRKAAKSK